MFSELTCKEKIKYLSGVNLKKTREFIPAINKNGTKNKQGHGTYYYHSYYTELNECWLCGKLSTPKKVQYRNDLLWDWMNPYWIANKRNYDFKSPLYFCMENQLSTDTDMLCMSCYNKAKKISLTMENIIDLYKSINKFKRLTAKLKKGEEIMNQDVTSLNAHVDEIRSFGDARRVLLQSIIAIRDKTMTTNDALAMAKVLEAVNHNIQCEINYGKLAILANDKGKQFGETVKMGQNILVGD